jgi:hypothetical protein
LPFMRAIRDSSAFFKLIHSALRGSYYTILDILYPRGIWTALSGNVQVRLAPRLNGMRPAGYEPVLSGILDQYSMWARMSACIRSASLIELDMLAA